MRYVYHTKYTSKVTFNKEKINRSSLNGVSCEMGVVMDKIHST
jgi:hypothetical protein